MKKKLIAKYLSKHFKEVNRIPQSDWGGLLAWIVDENEGYFICESDEINKDSFSLIKRIEDENLNNDSIIIFTYTKGNIGELIKKAKNIQNNLVD